MLLFLAQSSQSGVDASGSGYRLISYSILPPMSGQHVPRLVRAQVVLSALASGSHVFEYWWVLPGYESSPSTRVQVTKPIDSMTSFLFQTPDLAVGSPDSGSLELWLRMVSGTGTLSYSVHLYDSGATRAITYWSLDHLVADGQDAPVPVAGTVFDRIMGTGSGQYERTTDSLEALSDRLSLGLGPGFSAPSDSLHALRSAIDRNISQAVGSGTTSGTCRTSSGQTGTGFLGDVVQRVRRYCDEPGLDSAFSDSQIIQMVQDAWIEVFRDVNQVADWKQWVSFVIELESGITEYRLPPVFDQILMLESVVSGSGGQGQVLWDFTGEYVPRHPLNYGGAGWSIEGNVLRVDPSFTVSGGHLRITYRPSGEVYCHEAVAAGVTADSVKFPASVSVGQLDTRHNAYAGYVIRLLSGSYGDQEFYQQERMIRSYDESSRNAKVYPAFDPVPLSDGLVYEVIPQSADQFRKVLALKVARMIAHMRANPSRGTLLNLEYQDAKRSLLAHFANMNQRTGKLMHRGTRRGGRARL